MPFEPKLTNAVFDPAKHAETLENVRLWDWRALQSTLRQVQEIRTYYDFPDIDVDRYNINGKPQAIMLAARELAINKLPSGSQNWVNERLIFTHGYGVTMSPVSRFTKEGLPEFILSNMPVESIVPGDRSEAARDLFWRDHKLAGLRKDGAEGIQLSRKATRTTTPPMKAAAAFAWAPFSAVLRLPGRSATSRKCHFPTTSLRTVFF